MKPGLLIRACRPLCSLWWLCSAPMLLGLPFQAQAQAQEHSGHTAHAPSAAVPNSENLRDPHAYSGGYTLEHGPYALPGPRQLHLADEHLFATLQVDRLEWRDTDQGSATGFALEASFGNTYNHLLVKAEGEHRNSTLEEAQLELLWNHAIDSFWDARLGVRHDFSEGPTRNWIAFGIAGTLPYHLELETSAYLGTQGRTALKLETRYDARLTRQLVLQPRLELDWRGKTDPESHLGSGLAQATAGLRLHYEISRQFSPYLGIERVEKFGRTADFARLAGESERDTRYVAGLHFWF